MSLSLIHIYHPAGDLGYSRLLEKQSWHGELENLLDRQIEGVALSEAEWKRFEELTELAAGLKEQEAPATAGGVRGGLPGGCGKRTGEEMCIRDRL